MKEYQIQQIYVKKDSILNIDKYLDTNLAYFIRITLNFVGG